MDNPLTKAQPTIYPDELYQLHQDLDKLVYKDLDPEERAEIFERLPGTLQDAERAADQMLADHLQKMSDTIGMERYCQIVMEAASDDAKILYALRCLIASAQITAEPDTIEIYTTKIMQNTDFHNPENVSILPDGSSLIDETAESKNPYSRALSFDESRRQRVASLASRVTMKLRDMLPEEMLPKAKEVLSGYGINATEENAWKLLDQGGREADIEDRIVSRILYLITNATMVQRKQQPPFQLPIEII